MKDEKKILFVSGSLNRGGAQRVITLLANDYAQRGWSVHIIVMMNAEVGYELNPAIKIHDFVRHGNQLKMQGSGLGKSASV